MIPVYTAKVSRQMDLIQHLIMCGADPCLVSPGGVPALTPSEVGNGPTLYVIGRERAEHESHDLPINDRSADMERATFMSQSLVGDMAAAASSSSSSSSSRNKKAATNMGVAAPSPPPPSFAGVQVNNSSKEEKKKFIYRCANADCNFCSANKSLLVACRYHEAYYCTKQCQLAHWKVSNSPQLLQMRLRQQRRRCSRGWRVAAKEGWQKEERK